MMVLHIYIKQHIVKKLSMVTQVLQTFRSIVFQVSLFGLLARVQFVVYRLPNVLNPSTSSAAHYSKSIVSYRNWSNPNVVALELCVMCHCIPPRTTVIPHPIKHHLATPQLPTFAAQQARRRPGCSVLFLLHLTHSLQSLPLFFPTVDVISHSAPTRQQQQPPCPLPTVSDRSSHLARSSPA